MRRIAISVLALAPLAGYIGSSERIKAHPTPIAADRTLSVVSLNIAKQHDSGKIIEAIRRAPRLRDADVYLFQEVCNENGEASVADEVARRLGYSVSFAEAAPGVHDQGLAVVSRFPIANVEIKRLKESDLRFRSRKRFALAVSVKTPWDEVRIWNLHLDTRINSEERLDQLRPVLDDAARHSGARLIGGDFNTNNMYWLGNVLPLPFGPAHGAAIRAAMKKLDFESPFPDALATFPLLGRHLDWIYLRGLEVLDSSMEPALFSDHNAIWTRVRI